MRPGRIAALLGTVVLLATGLYFFVYLWRWEWNRALTVGMLFLAVEIAMATAAVLARLRQIADRPAPPEPAVLSRIRDAAPPAGDRFEWLSPRTEEMGVFVPLLIGMGVVASALAWLVERVARRTAGPALERGLASRLARLGWPTDGLIPDNDYLAVLDRPVPNRR